MTAGLSKRIISSVDDEDSKSQAVSKPWLFKRGDPRRMNGRPAGLPNKVNRPAKAVLEAAQEEVAKGLVEMTKAEREGETCILCGRGALRNEDTRIRASSEVLDRGGTPRFTQVEVSETPDTAWMEYLTDDQLDTLSRWIDEAKERMPFDEERTH